MNTEVEFDEKGLVAKVAHAALDVLRRTGAYVRWMRRRKCRGIPRHFRRGAAQTDGRAHEPRMRRSGRKAPRGAAPQGSSKYRGKTAATFFKLPRRFQNCRAGRAVSTKPPRW